LIWARAILIWPVSLTFQEYLRWRTWWELS